MKVAGLWQPGRLAEAWLCNRRVAAHLINESPVSMAWRIWPRPNGWQLMANIEAMAWRLLWPISWSAL